MAPWLERCHLAEALAANYGARGSGGLSLLCGELEFFMLILLGTSTTKLACTHLISTSPAAKFLSLSPLPHIIRSHLMAHLTILAPSVK